MRLEFPLRNRVLAQFRRPILFAPLCFLAGGFWAKAVMNNDNSLKSHNTLFRGILTHLNTDDKITHLLGEDIHYDDKIHPFVKGAVNHIKGISDLEFYVQGRKGINALVIFKGKKDDVSDFWISDEFTVKTEEQLIKY